MQLHVSQQSTAQLSVQGSGSDIGKDWVNGPKPLPSRPLSSWKAYERLAAAPQQQVKGHSSPTYVLEQVIGTLLATMLCDHSMS
jgi:hypothetical protein